MVNKKIFFILVLSIFLVGNVSAVIINEVMPWPTQKDDFNEWIEIYNPGTSSVNLSEYTLCGKQLLEGFIDHSDNLIKQEKGIILEGGKYAIITDGGSGTEVYSNFAINPDALAVHADASSLCSRLTNTGKNISLEKNYTIIDWFNYSEAENGKSFSIIKDKIEVTNFTPGYPNKENQPSKDSDSVNKTTIEAINESGLENLNTTNKNDSNTSFENNPKLKNKKATNTIALNKENTKDIKSEDNYKKLDKNDYAKYGIIGFCILLLILFLFKSKLPKKEYKNEFN